MNPPFVRLRMARALLFAVALLAMACPLHAQNTHRAALVRSSSQYFSAPDSPSLSITGDLTIEAWVKFVSIPPAGLDYLIVAKRNVPNEFSYRLQLYNNQLGSSLSGNGSAEVYRGVGWTPDLGAWYHVACVYSASAGSTTYYVNGVQQGSPQTGNPTGLFDSAAPCTIGGYSPSTCFDGSIDEVRIWGTARTQSQIRATMFNELPGTESGLKGYWRFNNSLTDSSGNGNTLTNNNSATFEINDLPFYSSSAPLEFCPDKDTLLLLHLNDDVVDASANPVTAVKGSATAYTAGKLTRGMTQDDGGSNRYVDLGSPAKLDISQYPIAVAGWFKTSANFTQDNGEMLIFTSTKPSSNYSRYDLAMEMNATLRGNIDFEYVNATGSHYLIQSSEQFNDGIWHWVCGAIQSNGVMHLYGHL